MIAWFAGIFYLPRLFVHHAVALEAGNTDAVERLKIMERKLFKFMTPLGVLAVAFGTSLLVKAGWPGYFAGGAWLHAKLTLVAFLIGYHVWLGFLTKKFVNDEAIRGHVFYRVINELPVLVMFAVVILVIVKPF